MPEPWTRENRLSAAAVALEFLIGVATLGLFYNQNQIMIAQNKIMQTQSMIAERQDKTIQGQLVISQKLGISPDAYIDETGKLQSPSKKPADNDVEPAHK